MSGTIFVEDTHPLKFITILHSYLLTFPTYAIYEFNMPFQCHTQLRHQNDQPHWVSYDRLHTTPKFHPIPSRRFLIPEFNFSPQRQSRDKMVYGKKGYKAISTPGVQIFEKIFFYSISTNCGTRSYKQKFFAISAHSKDSQLSAVVSVLSNTRNEKVIFFLDAQWKVPPRMHNF